MNGIIHALTIGVGTTSPATPLQVNGTASVTKLGVGTTAPAIPLEVIGTASASSLGLGVTTPKTTLQVNGGVSAKVAPVTTCYPMSASDFAVFANAASKAFKVTLPAASTAAGMIVHIKKNRQRCHKSRQDRLGRDRRDRKRHFEIALQAVCEFDSDL